MSACTCGSHLHDAKHRTYGRCTRPGCMCSYAPPKRRQALMRPRQEAMHWVDEHGVVHDFQVVTRPAVEVVPDVQTMAIPDWHPTMSANGSHGHWRTHQARHDADQRQGLRYAEHFGWTFMPGRVSLTITLVYPRTYRVDADNLAARCKGLIDGLRLRKGRGFFTDDSTEWLDLYVKADVRKGVKATEITLRRALEASAATTHQLALTGGD